MNETYSQLDDLRRSAIEFEDKFTNVFFTLNESSIALSRLSIDIERASDQLTQASGSPMLLLISEDFANTLSNAAMDLKELSQAFESQSLSLDDIFKTVDEIDDVTRMGVKIINFIRNSLKSFSVIIRAIAIELESINVTLTTFKNSMFILGLDAALVHFSLLIIGYLIKNKRMI
jgi:methyl-accepting chemotaxis protein